jgi:hypothetical protein
MRGTVVRRSGGYSVVLDLGPGPDGKRVRKWHSGFRTKRDAERARVELLAALDRGGYVEPHKLTVAGFLTDQWLPSVKAQVKPSTLRWHTTNVRKHLVPAVGAVLLQKLSPGHLNALYATLSEGGLSSPAPSTMSTPQGDARSPTRSGGAWCNATSPASPRRPGPPGPR